MTILLFFVLFTLTISFFCSLLEATVLSFSPSQVAALERTAPGGGAIWRRFKENIERPIAVILITNTAAHTIGATMAGAQFETWFKNQFGPEGTSQGLIVFSIVFTYLMLQFTEILPKSLGVRYNGFLAPVVARPMALAIQVMSPVVWFIRLVNKPFERGHVEGEDTLDEISALAASARLRQVMDPRQARIIQVASEAEDIRVRQIMTPRTDVTYLRVDSPIEETLEMLRKSPYTRIPICEDEFDHVLGMVHVKDVLAELNLQTVDSTPNEEGGLAITGSGELDLRKIRRDVLVLPDHLDIFRALRQFQESRIHLAIIVDEYGSALGLVTLEDVLEELVGEIDDEFDTQTRLLIHQEGDDYRVDGRFPLHELQHHVPDIGIDHVDFDADTVGGFILQEVGKMPNPGESVYAGNYRWEVTKTEAQRILEIVLHRETKDDDDDSKDDDKERS